MKSEKPDAPTHKSIVRGATAVETMMNDLQELYNDHAKFHEPEAAEVYESIASNIAQEALDVKHAPADVAVLEPRRTDVPGHGMLIEFYTSQDSMMGKVGKDLGVQVIRCTETHMNVEHDTTMVESYEEDPFFFDFVLIFLDFNSMRFWN